MSVIAKLSRRRFLKYSTAGLLAAAGAPKILQAKEMDDISSTVAAKNLQVAGTVSSNLAGTVGNPSFGLCIGNFPISPWGGKPSPAPTVPYSLYRTHDGPFSKWWDIQPTSRTSFNWTNLDTVINYHLNAGRDVLFTLYGTPTWASARPTEALSPYAINPGDYVGGSAEPANMGDWANYCAAIAGRYPRIKYFEVNNEPSPFMVFVLSGTAGNNTITVASAGQIAKGMMISPYANGIPANCTVTGISGNTLTLSSYLKANLTNAQIEFSQYFPRTCSGNAASSSITVDDASGLVVGLPVSLYGNQYTITAVSGTIVTLSATLTTTVSNAPLIISYKTGNIYFSGWKEMLTTLTRVAAVAIKAVNPAAQIIAPCASQIQNQYYPVVPPLPHHTQACFNNISTVLTAGDAGISYKGSTGLGSACMDWADIIGTHLYIGTNTEYLNIANISYLKQWLLTTTSGTKPLWCTEAGVDRSGNQADADYVTQITRLVLCPLLLGFQKFVYYEWDSSTYALNTASAAVIAAITNNINFVANKTCIALQEPIPGGPITASFSDGTALTF